METESEDEGSQRKSRLLRSCYPPYLRLHEGKEYEERLREEQGERSNAVDDRYAQYWRFYRIHRFFDSIIGFHEGSLDLSGRHYPRYQKLISRWDDYLVDFQIIESSAKKAYTEYTFREGTIKTLDSSPTPKFQNRFSFHLPVEVLQIIYQIARLNDARTLSSTSKRMREIGEPFIFGSRVLNMDVPRERLSTIREETGAREPEFFVAFQELANGARQAYLGKVDFLLSREDILRKLNKLSLINVWNGRRYEIKYIAGGHMPTKQDPSFFDLIHGRNSSVLHHAAHITQLKIEGLQIPIDYLDPVHGFQACILWKSVPVRYKTPSLMLYDKPDIHLLQPSSTLEW
ncbi:hypothetical protein CPB86DRAFT_820093 [Serendipita vermifera]|nr:hypothetical protein CPB86DRAFT_820093 [Serendipita vermifera]